MEYQLAAGESIVLDTGYLAAMSESCKLKVETVPGLKNKFFGGEGFFNTVVSGPGHVWIQTMPANKMAGALHPVSYTHLDVYKRQLLVYHESRRYCPCKRCDPPSM